MSTFRVAAEKVLRGIGWLIVPAFVIASLWLPVLLYYRVPEPQISLEVVQRSRQVPRQSQLNELKGDRLLGHVWKGCDVVRAADGLLRGELSLNPPSVVPFRLPFRPENLTVGSLVTQLYVAGLVPVDFLLQAHECTGEERYFAAARSLIVEFAGYERRAWLRRGYLWDDHAAANRIFVLSDFWRVYRARPDFDVRTARSVLTLAARSGELLARPRLFAFHGNHGVMQNIGLLRLGLGFPTLPKARAYGRLGIARLDGQLAHYISEEGVVLEHSASYQFMGVDLLRRAARYARLLGQDIPAAWNQKLERAREYASVLPRPDRTLPAYGDTRWAEQWVDTLAGQPGAVPARPAAAISINPVAGYAIWWTGLEDWPEASRLRQTILTFSYFPGHIHKHADELSVLLWAGGRMWWTNVGYWPFDRPEREQAISWNGSNAPHLQDESSRSTRVSRLLAHGTSRSSVAADVVREGPDGFRARRQIVHVKPDHWLVIDTVSGAPGRTSVTRWTTGQGVHVIEDQLAGPQLLRDRGGPAQLFVSFFGSTDATVRTLSQTLGPFLREGMSAEETMVAGVEVTQPGHTSWMATAWTYDAAGTAAPSFRPTMKVWRNADQWSALLPYGPTVLEITRQGSRLIVHRDGRLADTVLLQTTDAEPARQAIVAAFERTAQQYPRFPWRPRLRRWGTAVLVGVLCFQELAFLGIARRAARLYRSLRILALAVWVVGAIVLGAVLGW